MTIRAKLYTAIVVAVAGLALTVGVGIWAMDRLGDRFDRVQAAGDARSLALQLKFDVTDFNGWQTAYGYDGGKSRPEYVASSGRFERHLSQARRQAYAADRTIGPRSDQARRNVLTVSTSGVVRASVRET